MLERRRAHREESGVSGVIRDDTGTGPVCTTRLSGARSPPPLYAITDDDPYTDLSEGATLEDLRDRDQSHTTPKIRAKLSLFSVEKE